MNNISFKGYSNIVSAQKVNIGALETSYIAFKLDDNGEKDLSKLREIRKLQKYPPDYKNDDILTLIHVTDKKYEELYFSENLMCWGEQLKVLKDEYVPQHFKNVEFKKIEQAHLKAYTLLASLTKRMAQDKFENEDVDIKRVIQTLYKNLQVIGSKDFRIFDKEEAFELTSVGCLKISKFQSLAAKFNKKIASTMIAYFR